MCAEALPGECPRLGARRRRIQLRRSQGLHPCVKDSNTNRDLLLPNGGYVLTNDKQIELYKVSSWIAQTAKNVSDITVTLSSKYAGVPSLAIDTTATGISSSPDRCVDNLRSPQQGSVMSSALCGRCVMATTRIRSLQESLPRGVGEMSRNRRDQWMWQARNTQDPKYVAQATGRFALASPSAAQQPVPGVRRTPALPAPAVGVPLLTSLNCGAPATSSPVLQSPVIHRFGAAVRRLPRKGVTPTEQ
jgi:hypothetical protein